MKRFVLDRELRLPKAILGVLYDLDSEFEIQTLELPWKDNKPEVSCVPEGIYTCKRDIHGKKSKNPYECWELTNVPNRSEVHIHIANYPYQILGCIAVGLERNEDVPAVYQSKKAFDWFMNITKDETEIELEIRNTDGVLEKEDITQQK